MERVPPCLPVIDTLYMDVLNPPCFACDGDDSAVAPPPVSFVPHPSIWVCDTWFFIYIRLTQYITPPPRFSDVLYVLSANQ